MSEESRTDWQHVRLGDHTTVKARLGWKGLKADEYVDDGFVFLATPNLKGSQIDFRNVNYISKWRYDESPEIQLRENDVLIVKDGSTLGICSFVRSLPRPASVNGSITVVRSRTSLHPEFLYHFVTGDEFQELIKLKKAGLGVPHLFQADLREFPVSLPPLPEQRKIAAILTTVDSLIEQTEALIEKYRRVKQGMMADLFTRGVDSSGQLRPTQQQAPDLYKQSELGWIPKDWVPTTVGKELHSIDAGKSPNCPDQPATDGEWGVLKVSAVQPDGFRPDENKIIVDRIHINPAYEVQSGDLLLSRSNTYQLVGIVSLVAETRSLLMLCDKTLRLRFNQSQAKTAFMFWQLQQPAVRRQIEIYATGTSGSMKNISQPSIRGLKFARPSVEEQEEIANRIFSVQRRIRSEAVQNEKLRKLKSGLMQDLLTGKVRVKVDEPEEVTAGV